MNEPIGVNQEGVSRGGTALFSIAAGVLIVIVSLVLYINTYNYDLVFDDKHIINENVSITSLPDNPSGFFDLYGQEFWEGSHAGSAEYIQPKGQALYRPVMLTALGMVYCFDQMLQSDEDGEKKSPARQAQSPFAAAPGSGLSSAPSPGNKVRSAPFHVLNIILNALVCLTTYVAVKKLFRSTRLGFFAGLIFACHPIHTESVAYVTGVGELLSALFFFLAIIFYVKASYDEGRFRILPYLLSLFFFLAGLFTKEHVITLLGVLVLYDFIQFLAGQRPIGIWQRLGMYSGYAVVILINIAARYNAIGYLRPTQVSPIDNVIAWANRNGDYAKQLWTALRVLMKGIWMTIAPMQLTPDYSYAAIPLNESPLQAEVLAAILFVLTLLFIGIVSLRKNPILAFGIFWHFVTISVVSNIVIVVGTIFGERLLLIPSLAFCLVAAFILDRIFKMGSTDDRRFGSGAVVASILLVALAGVYSFKTVKECKKWESDEKLWHAASKVVLWQPKQPAAAGPEQARSNSAKVHFQLGQIFRNMEYYNEAEKEYIEALRIDDTFFMAQLSLGELYMLKEQYDKALEIFEAIKGSNAYAEDESLQKLLRGKLAFMYAISNNPEEAIAELLSMKEQNNTPAINVQIGELYFREKDFDNAAKYFQEARQLGATSQIEIHIGELYLREGLLDEAAEYFQAAWDRDPDLFDAAYRLLLVYGQAKRFEEEGELLDLLEEKDTETNRAFLARAGVCMREFDNEKALGYFDKAIERSPDVSRSYLMKASLLNSMFRFDEALATLDRALELIDESAAPQGKAEALALKLEIYKEKRDFQGAEEIANQLVRLSQLPPSVKASLGELFLKLKRYPEAVQYCKESIAAGMAHTTNFVNLGQALSSLGKFEDVVDFLLPAVEEAGLAHHELYKILGIALNATGDYQRGAEILRETLIRWGPNPWVKYPLAEGEFGLKNYKKAADILERLETSPAASPLLPYIYNLQALILLEDESSLNPEKAGELASKARDMLADDCPASVYLTLAKARAAAGNNEEARKVVEDALKKHPKDKALQDLLETLK